ncbi:MAG: hypothetical protein ACI81R_001918 [Bradymonadia bacterium]|jgi:hypothetical protein
MTHNPDTIIEVSIPNAEPISLRVVHHGTEPVGVVSDTPLDEHHWRATAAASAAFDVEVDELQCADQLAHSERGVHGWTVRFRRRLWWNRAVTREQNAAQQAVA